MNGVDPSAVLRQQLGPDEHLLWSGRPRRGVVLRAGDVFMVPFSLMWCGFAIFWEWSVCTSGAPLFFRLWGVPFVLVGLYFVFGRFLWEAHQRGQTYYGVSNQRILIVNGSSGNKVKSLVLRTLADVSLSKKVDGSGSIQFGAAGPFGGSAWFPASGWPGVPSVPTFELIENVKHVDEVIRQAQRSA